MAFMLSKLNAALKGTNVPEEAAAAAAEEVARFENRLTRIEDRFDKIDD